MPARFIWTNEGEAVGFIPTRYPGSTASADPAIQLARRTDWHDAGADWSLPLGQRMLVTDVDETALMDIRSIRHLAGCPPTGMTSHRPLPARTTARRPKAGGE